MATSISGIFAPITTPFVNEKVSLEHLRENVRKYRKTPLRGFFVLGSNGESKSLTEQEKLKILETVLKEKSRSQIIMAGAGYESTRQTIAFSRKVASLGANFVSLVTPSYFKNSLTDEALIGYYTDVAEALSIPVLIYNAPGFTGIAVSPKVIQALSKHPNIAGMKDTSPGNTASYIEVSDEKFAVLAGTINYAAKRFQGHMAIRTCGRALGAFVVLLRPNQLSTGAARSRRRGARPPPARARGAHAPLPMP